MGYYYGIALISGATLLVELALLRLFAVQQFYHFAFMAISLALLSAGASGSLLSIWPKPLSPSSLSLSFSITTVGAYLVINYLPFDSFSIAWDNRQLVYLALYFLAITIPFLFSGLLVGGALIKAGDGDTAGSHLVYGANLIGSAVGSISSLAILSLLAGEGAVILAAVLGAGAGLLFGRESEKWSKLIRTTTLLLLILGLVVLFRPPAFLKQRLSPYKTLSVLSQAIDTKHILTEWDASTRIDVVESNTIHIMPGLSLSSPAGPPPQAGLMLDGDNLMPITRLSPDSEEAAVLASYLPGSLAYQLRPNGRSLIIEPGTGMDILFALASGAEQVTVVEDNKLIIQVMEGPFREFTSGLFTDSRVKVQNQLGRVFARQLDMEKYEIVIIPLTDPHRSVTSGAYSLTENYIYTVEAIGDYLNTLDDDGLLVITRWLQVPPSESGRTFGMVTAALSETERNPAAHLIAYRTLRTMTILASLQPVTAAEVEITRDFLKTRGFDGVYFPGIQPEDLNRYNILPEPVYHRLFTDILNQPEKTYADYRFDIRPPTDDHPFFFHFFKWRQTPEILASLGLTWQPFGGSGFFVLVALLLLVGLASAVFIIAPLFINRNRTARYQPNVTYWKPRVFGYFAMLGLAFLFIEIPLAQRFILVLGQPVTALAVVIFTLLLFSGLGSLTVKWWRLQRGLLLLILLIAIYPLLLKPVTDFILGWPEWGRMGATIFILAPLGYLMGIPFANGLRLVEVLDPSVVPWAWAINGSFSVISAVLAVMIALTWGFSAVLWFGAAAYGIALGLFYRL